MLDELPKKGRQVSFQGVDVHLSRRDPGIGTGIEERKTSTPRKDPDPSAKQAEWTNPATRLFDAMRRGEFHASYPELKNDVVGQSPELIAALLRPQGPQGSRGTVLHAAMFSRECSAIEACGELIRRSGMAPDEIKALLRTKNSSGNTAYDEARWGDAKVKGKAALEDMEQRQKALGGNAHADPTGYEGLLADREKIDAVVAYVKMTRDFGIEDKDILLDPIIGHDGKTSSLGRLVAGFSTCDPLVQNARNDVILSLSRLTRTVSRNLSSEHNKILLGMFHEAQGTRGLFGMTNSKDYEVLKDWKSVYKHLKETKKVLKENIKKNR